jgi:tRNA modification GTPase
MVSLDDTIAAVASPSGGAARGIVRMSGPDAIGCLAHLFDCDDAQPIAALPYARAVAGSLRLPGIFSPLPCEAYLWPDGRSYTGQPVVEIHTLGSPPLLSAVLRSFCTAGARLAGPGEFTLRAFLAGRIDLTQAEAVLGVIDAGDSHELQVALAQLAGGLARPLHGLRDTLLDLLAHIEAGFDFADEDLAFITRDELDRQLSAAQNEIAAIERQMASRTDSTHAIRAVLIGRPNTGKSSLFNVLAGDRAALVSEHPGTTRDYLTAELDLDGVKCQLIDTAGVLKDKRGERGESGRETADGIAEAAESATIEQRRGARIELLCIESGRPLDAWERDELACVPNGPRIVVMTKCDSGLPDRSPDAALETSSRTGVGIAALRDELRRQALAVGRRDGDVVAGTAVRCAESLRLAGECLHRARHVAAAGQDELAAAEVRTSLTELGKVVGAVYTEDVLDRIFSRFCVGK